MKLISIVNFKVMQQILMKAELHMPLNILTLTKDHPAKHLKKTVINPAKKLIITIQLIQLNSRLMVFQTNQ